MRLNLTLNGVLVATAAVDPARCKDEFYLMALRRLILRQNRDIVEAIPAKPFFYLEVPASCASLYFSKSERGYVSRN